MASRLLALISAAYGDPTDEEGIEQRLRDAVERSELPVLQRLLPIGDAASATRVGKYGFDLLLTAVRRDDQPIVDHLMSIMDALVVEENRRELVAAALSHSSALAMERLARDGLDTATHEDDEPLVFAAVRLKLEHDEAERVAKMQSGGFFARLSNPWDQNNGPTKSQKAEDFIACLLRHGVDANTTGRGGDTALHLASRSSSGASVVVLLLRFGTALSLHKMNDDGFNPLHVAIQARNVEVVKLLLNAGADASVPTKAGETPLQMAIFTKSARNAVVYELARALVAYGRATWDSGCEACLIALDKTEDSSRKSRWERSSHWESLARRKFAGSIRICVNQWVQDAIYGMPFASVPIEVLSIGEKETATYIKTMKTSHLDDVVLRRKVCVVGPSEWGKTSLVKSIVSKTPSLVHAEDGRTIGIDLLGYAFSDKSHEGPAKYEVTFWDFAGQDIYQVAHTLFFSRRTLYLVCVDLGAYAHAMREARAQPTLREKEAFIQRFVMKNILHWIRLIFVRQPDAEFIVVGTKCDVLKTNGQGANMFDPVEAIWQDLRVRVKKWKHSLVIELDEAIRNATDTCPAISYPSAGSIFGLSDKTQLQDVKNRIHTILNGEWIAVSAVKADSVYSACALLEQTIARSACGFAMPTAYSQVLKAIHVRREGAAGLDPKQRVQNMIVPSYALCEALVEDVEGLTVDTCQSILRTLHELGDILWYELETAGILQDCVILDPTIVLDLVRQVVNHNYADEHESTYRDGRVTHSNLLKEPLWKELDAELMLAFKSLLHYYQLAYPADNQPMDWDSDLIVPAYWKTNKDVSHANRVQHSDGLDSTTQRVCWEYELSSTMSEMVFENVAVLSHTSFARRRVEQRRFEAVDVSANVTARVSLHDGASPGRDLLRIESGSSAGNSHAAWNYARFYIMTIEQVLEAYPGLTASRYVVAMDRREVKHTRHRVNDVIKIYHDALIMDKNDTDVEALLPWTLPSNLEWYVEKAWRRPGILNEIRMRGVVDNTSRKMDVLRRLVAADKSRRQYPALWTLEYSDALVTVKMLSDVSGDCFHEPIEIEVPSTFWVQHGAMIQRGLSIISTVLPEAISLGIVSKVARLAASGLDAKVERAVQVHNAIEQLDISLSTRQTGEGVKLSARGGATLLRDLLVLQDPTFHELKIPRISNLQCATTVDGAFVWAHPEEIADLGEALTPCDLCGDSIQLLDESSSVPAAGIAPCVAPLQIDSSSAQLQLRISGIGGLAEWDWRKLYCKWEVQRSETTIASGVTPPQPSNTDTWAWGLLAFPIALDVSVDMLRECRLVVEVKRPSRCPGVIKSIGTGSSSLAACTTTNGSKFMPTTIRVALAEDGTQTKQPRWVTCQLSLEPPAASA